MWSTRWMRIALCSGSMLAATSGWCKDCVGVATAGGGYSFWGEVCRGARKAGEELGIAIYCRGPADENQPESQRLILDTIEQIGCKALVLAPNVPERAADVARFKARGVPAVYIDRDFGNSEAIAVVSTDNYRAGQQAGQHMARQLKPHGRVAVFRMKRGVQSTDERERGFIDAARGAGLTIETEAWIGNGVGEAREHATQELSRMKTPVDGIFTPNESTTLATLVSLKQAGLAGKLKLVGFDMNSTFIDALKDDSLSGVIVQRPVEMGYQGVITAYRAAQGRTPEKRHIDTGAFLVTKMNLNAPEFAQDLAPILSAPR